MGLVKFTAVVGAPLHTTWLATGSTVAVGFTVYVKVAGVPAQVVPALVYDGVTVIVAVTGAVVTLVAVKLGILPVPVAAKPILVVVFVQLYVVLVDVYNASTYKRLNVPPQGSPKVVLLAGIETLVWPVANADTIDILLAAWQPPIVKLPQTPLGVP